MDTFIGAVEAEQAVPKPRFILELEGFKIRDTNVPAVAQDLEKQGFGVISYTWARFQDKTTYEDSPNAPKFDEIDADGLQDPIRWYIPKLKEGAFTMKDIRGIIEKLKMKYVWWDWACIPQYWDSTDTTKPGSGPIKDPKRPQKVIGDLEERHKAIAVEEIAKQFYIYAMAKKSLIWMHDLKWAGSWSPQLLKTAIQTTLENYSSLPTRNKSIEDPEEAMPAVKAFVKHYQSMKQDSKWLSSMWAFQEGILLSSDDVIDPRDNRVLGIRKWDQFARIVDKEGKAFAAKTCFQGEATLLDITGRAKYLACLIAGYVARAVEENKTSVAAEHQTWLSLLYETGLVGVPADSPLELLYAAKARSFPTMRDVDYCLNALMGALRVVLPDGTPTGLDSPTALNARRTALLTALVARYGWRMVLLSKPSRGTWNDSYPTDMTAGNGDWIASLLTRTWAFTPLSIFITTQLGRNNAAPLPFAATPSMWNGSRAPDSSQHIKSFAQPVPHTDNVLLLGAEYAFDRMALPPLRHASAVHAALGLSGGGDAPDALVVGPEKDAAARMFGYPPPYGAFFYHVRLMKPRPEGSGGGGGVDVVDVAQGPAWTSCRFYASRAKPAQGNPGDSAVKTGECFLRRVEFATAFRKDIFGAEVGVVLLPIEDVVVPKPRVQGSGQRPERVPLVRCVVLTDFRAGRLRNRSDVLVGGGIFLGIGDFTFNGIPQTASVESVLGKGWMIYMY